jgi:hypothetical protein
MKLILIKILILACCTAGFCQNETNSHILKPLSFRNVRNNKTYTIDRNDIDTSKINTKDYSKGISIGAGLSSDNYKNFSYAFNINFKFRIYKFFYCQIGLEIYRAPLIKYETRILWDINAIPTLNLNLFNDRLTLFIGAGSDLFYGFNLTETLGIQYNFPSKKISVGIDLKTLNTFGHIYRDTPRSTSVIFVKIYF